MSEKAIISYLLPYLNLDQSNILPGLKIPDEAQAAIFKMSINELIQKKHDFQRSAKDAAIELLKDEGFQEKLTSLPFKENDTIVLVGDSSSDEKGGWVDILKYVIQLGTDIEVNIDNESVFGSTSSEILRHLGTTVMAKKPDWVMLNFGTWDAFRPNYASNRPLISLTDFWENTQSIQEAIGSLETRNPIIWIAPSLVNEELANEYPLINGSFDNSEIRSYQEVIRDKSGLIVDPYFNRFGQNLESWNYAVDGVHFSLAGSIQTVKTLIDSLIKELK